MISVRISQDPVICSIRRIASVRIHGFCSSSHQAQSIRFWQISRIDITCYINGNSISYNMVMGFDFRELVFDRHHFFSRPLVCFPVKARDWPTTRNSTSRWPGIAKHTVHHLPRRNPWLAHMRASPQRCTYMCRIRDALPGFLQFVYAHVLYILIYINISLNRSFGFARYTLIYPCIGRSILMNTHNYQFTRRLAVIYQQTQRVYGSRIKCWPFVDCYLYGSIRG